MNSVPSKNITATIIHHSPGLGHRLPELLQLAFYRASVYFLLRISQTDCYFIFHALITGLPKMGICKENLLPVSCCSQLSKLDESCVRGFLLITRTKDPEPILNCVLLYLVHRLRNAYGTSTVGFKVKNIPYKSIFLDFVFPILQLYQLFKLNRCIQDGKIKAYISQICYGKRSIIS